MTSDIAGDPVQLLKTFIACPSVTPETAGVLDVLDGALSAIGFTVTRLRFEGGGSYPVDNLFAIRGTSGRRLLFAGHTDVVPPGDLANWTSNPFVPREADGKLYGRGAADMKSGVAAFVAACAAIPDDAGTIMLAITNDVEADAINGTDKLMAWADAQQHHFDFAIVGEPSSAAALGDSIKIGRRGSLSGMKRVCASRTAGSVGTHSVLAIGSGMGAMGMYPTSPPMENGRSCENAPTSDTADPIFWDSAKDGWTSWMVAVNIGASMGPIPRNG